jgi:hypothetical protein
VEELVDYFKPLLVTQEFWDWFGEIQVFNHNTQMEAIGSGLVILVDGRDIKDTNLTR